MANTSSWRDNWKCYHRKIMTSDHKNKIQQDYEEIKEDLDVCLDVIKKESKLKVITHDEVEAKMTLFDQLHTSKFGGSGNISRFSCQGMPVKGY